MIDVFILLILLLACLYLSSFFSGSEMAYTTVNKVRLEKLSEEGNIKAARALKILERFESTLSAILIGNNLVNIASSSIGSVLVYLIFKDETYSWVSTLAITLIVIIFCETIPKIVCAKKATSKSLKYSLPLKIISFILTPVIFIITKFTHFLLLPFKGSKSETTDTEEESVEELQSIINTAEDEGILDRDDKEIITNAIDFADISASEAMTARVDVEAIDIEDSFEEILAFIESSTYSRIPVYQDSIDNIVGVLHLNKFLQAMSDNNLLTSLKKDKNADGSALKPILMPPLYVYKTMKMPTVLKELKKAKQHLAIVTDEYSGTLGIITMEDVLEQLVGDIWDETDVIEKEVEIKKDGEFIVDGDLPISDFLELAKLDEDTFDAESETVGGWAVEVLERFPKEGDSFNLYNLTVTVLKVDGRRVEKLSVKNFSEKD